MSEEELEDFFSCWVLLGVGGVSGAGIHRLIEVRDAASPLSLMVFGMGSVSLLGAIVCFFQQQLRGSSVVVFNKYN